MTDTITTPVFTIERHFAAPVEKVFDAWADPAQMVAWTGPTGSQTQILDGRIAEGATMHARQEAADGTVMFTLCRYETLSRPHRIAYEQSFADAAGKVITAPFFEHWPLVMRTEVDLVAEDGGTRLSLRWTPVGASAAELDQFAAMMTSMTGGWTGSFDRLEALLAR